MADIHADTALAPPSTPPTPTASARESANLSDVFSTSRSPSPSHPFATQHPTDIPRLRTTHITAGYRAGISVSKEPAVQPGFDEGYPLGATFGLKVGYLLGVLEGIVAAYNTGRGWAGKEEEEGKRLRSLLALARRELCVESIFKEGVWKSDGTWAYSVPGEEEDNVVWKEVVEAHPAIKKWEGIVGEEVSRAGLEMGRFEGPEWEAGRIGNDEGG